MPRVRDAAMLTVGLLGGLLLALPALGVRPVRALQDPPALPAPAEQATPVATVEERLPNPAPAAAPAPEADPEKTADAFVEKTRAEATAAVQSLRKEANELRARLKKVEGALQRWEGLLAGLPRHDGLVTVRPGAQDPGLPATLEPVPAAAPAPQPALEAVPPNQSKPPAVESVPLPAPAPAPR